MVHKMKLAQKVKQICETLLESASYSGKEELLPEGEDLEVGNLQYHRFRDSLRVVDFTNAGKKGKTGKEVTLYGSYKHDDQTAIEAFIADSIMKLKDIDDVEKAFKDLASTHRESGWQVQTRLVKGVDIFRKLGNEVEINNGSLRLSASPKNVSFEDLKDKNNNMSGYVNDSKKTELKKAWEVIVKNKEKIEKMSYQEFKQFFNDNGISYKTYAGMD